jgi:hypothetical protein
LRVSLGVIERIRGGTYQQDVADTRMRDVTSGRSNPAELGSAP